MLISKFNLYKSEWLELVFDNRNKDYGAYYLRQHYAGNMARAMGITFLGIGLLCGASIILRTDKPLVHIITINNPPVVMPPPIKPIEAVKPHVPSKPLTSPPSAPTVKITRDIPMTVVPDKDAQKPLVNAQIDGQIGQIDATGTKDPGNALPAAPTGGGDGTPVDDKTVYGTGGLDVMPEPMGGSAAWAKFLNKNLRFPYEAEGVSGRVYLSFIIEKDGRLSNITIDHAAGHGFDEEALRVLKMAKAWKPGMQNGQPVRVKYQIPINFQSAPAE